jgi:hypothetical protein
MDTKNTGQRIAVEVREVDQSEVLISWSILKEIITIIETPVLGNRGGNNRLLKEILCIVWWMIYLQEIIN